MRERLLKAWEWSNESSRIGYSFVVAMMAYTAFAAFIVVKLVR